MAVPITLDATLKKACDIDFAKKTFLEDAMVSKIGSSGPPSTPQTTAADKVETAKPADTTAAPQTPAEYKKPPAPSTEQKGQTQKFTEFAFAGITRAAQLLNFKTEETKLPTDELLKRNDNQKEPKPEVEELQKQVNQWRTDNGKKPIKEDGFYRPKN